MKASDLFLKIMEFTRTEPDRHGECHITCPECGKPSSPLNVHCSFSGSGWHCFVCGAGGSLRDLAERLNMETYTNYTPLVQPKKTKILPPWLKNPEPIVRKYEQHPRRYELWHQYKSLPQAYIDKYRLGVGALPPFTSLCTHQRLIVPIMNGTMIVGLRGRALDCTCGKWLAAHGSTLSNFPMYGSEEITARGMVIWIVENPIDALMISAYSHFRSKGLATYGVTYWRDEWTAWLVAQQPKMIYVAYDNDLPGNGGSWNRREMIDKWLLTHKKVPESNGIRLVNHLAAERLPVRLFNWRDALEKADIGNLISKSL